MRRNQVYAAGILLLAGVVVGIYLLTRGTTQPTPPPNPAPGGDRAASTIHASVACPGMSASEIDRTVLLPLVESLKGLDGFVSVHTVAGDGLGRLAIGTTSTDLHEVRQQIAERLARAQPMLPQGIEAPRLLSRDPDQLPLIWLAVVSGDDRASQLLAGKLRHSVAAVPGVADAVLFGGVQPVRSVFVDPQKLAAYNVTLGDVAKAIQQAKLSPDKADDEKRVVVAAKNDTPIRLGDLATIDEKSFTSDFFCWQGRRAVAVGVYPAADADVAKLAAMIRSAVTDWQLTFPKEARIEIALDSTAANQQAFLIDLQFAEGSTPETMERALIEIERLMVDRFGMLLSGRDAHEPNHAWILASTRSDRRLDVMERDLRKQIDNFPHVKARVVALGSESLPWSRAPAVQIRLTGHDLVQLCEWAREAIKLAEKDVENIGCVNAPGLEKADHIQLKVDREKAAMVGASMADIAALLQASLPYRPATGESPTYVLRLGQEFRNERDALDKVFVPTSKGMPVPLKDLVDLVRSTSWRILEGLNGDLCVTIYADPTPGASRDDARKKLLERVEEVRTALKLGATFKAE